MYPAPFPSVETNPYTRPKPEVETKPVTVNWAFVLGLSSLFIVNGLTSLLNPSGFIQLMKSSILTSWIPDYSQVIQLVGINDIGVGLLLLAYPKSRFIQTWAGLWLLAVAVLKATSLMG